MSDDETTIRALRNAVAAFVDERDWSRFHDPKNLAMSIAIEAAEIMEHVQWSRNDELDERMASDGARAAVAEELADVICYTLALANALDIDVSTTVHAKMKKNAEKYPVERYHGRYEADEG